MKPCVFEARVIAALGLLLIAVLPSSSAQVNADGQTPTPAPAKATDAPKGKKPKVPKDTGDPTLPPKQRKAKEIPFPVPVGKDAKIIKVPSYDQAGKLLSVLVAAKAHRMEDGDHVQLEGMTFDLSATDGKDGYKVVMPTCVLDLKTNIVTSEHAVTISTKEFDLTGERVRFNTVERSGELQGHVHMVIHNLKQVAVPGQPSADLQ